ncbi:hypothetical protein [Streptomyces palmae]|uniref:hypothetical protein n=1 Tax=Streptomyces palmae TaxID=1701085 RepID=UPI001FD7DBAB|nr:hypothetical protein [Streptomyces palmae]
MGIRSNTDAGGPGPFIWTDLSIQPGFFYQACGTSIHERGPADEPHPVYIDIITNYGEVFETECTVDPAVPALTCGNPWVPVTYL